MLRTANDELFYLWRRQTTCSRKPARLSCSIGPNCIDLRHLCAFHALRTSLLPFVVEYRYKLHLTSRYRVKPLTKWVRDTASFSWTIRWAVWLGYSNYTQPDTLSFMLELYTVFQKTIHFRPIFITALANEDRFFKFFHWQNIPMKTVCVCDGDFSHLHYVACKIWYFKTTAELTKKWSCFRNTVMALCQKCAI